MAPYSYKNIDFRKHPEKYRIGRGEEGVLQAEPYKSEILPLWKFKTPEEANISSQQIFDKFLDYLNQDDFVGADMAQKFLQMGYTRSMRYARHKSGRKYDDSGKEIDKDPDQEKLRSARIFKKQWDKARENPKYKELKEDFKGS